MPSSGYCLQYISGLKMIVNLLDRKNSAVATIYESISNKNNGQKAQKGFIFYVG
jgi:hypothetical protein